jgi:ComF family protein
MRPIAIPLGHMLAQAIASLAPTAPESMLVVPVPLHPRRERGRGFNQARLLATSALRSLHRTHPHWRLELSPASLVRQRETSPQASLQPRQRRINLEHAFRVARPQQVKGRAILLIDDIVTTGATARACAQSLLDAGAATVFVAALARAQMSFHNGNWIIEDVADAARADHQEAFDFSSTLDGKPTPHPT